MEEERDLLWRALRWWSETDESPGGALGVLTGGLLRVGDHALSRLVKKAPLPVVLVPADGLLVGPAVAVRGKEIVPVAVFGLSDGGGSLCVSLRVALIHFDEANESLSTDGWRYESAETASGAPHPWPHAQRITSWSKHSGTLADALDLGALAESGDGADDGTEPAASDDEHPAGGGPFEVRPAFPLACHTAAGLAVAMIASISGVTAVKELLASDSVLDHGLTQAERGHLSGAPHI